MAFAIWVPTSLWMGRFVSLKRDMELIQSLADKVRHMALCHPLLLAVDDIASYERVFRDAFRSKSPRQAGETEVAKWYRGLTFTLCKAQRIGSKVSSEKREEKA